MRAADPIIGQGFNAFLLIRQKAPIYGPFMMDVSQ